MATMAHLWTRGGAAEDACVSACWRGVGQGSSRILRHSYSLICLAECIGKEKGSGLWTRRRYCAVDAPESDMCGNG